MLVRILKIVFGIVLFGMLLGASTQILSDPIERVRSYTRQIEFDYVSWTLNALWVKWQQMSVGSQAYLQRDNQREVVLEYLDLVEQIRELESEAAQIYADPSVPDPDMAASQLIAQIETKHAQRDLLTPLAEAVFQDQLSQVLDELGLSMAGQPLPPVMYHVTPPPNALIVSPRNSIQQQANISINPDMSLEDITALEEQVADGLDVSSLVVGVGGVGMYPTMVMQTTDLNWLAEVVAHEWVHNFLTLRPLGASYLSSPELRIINETVASIAGKEIGQALISRFYPEYLPPTPIETGQEANEQIPAEPPPFDFRAEMHETRVAVDELLAQGKIEEAESYMELRRRYLWENGYRLRKLNQAYFAFYGAYADQPGGAAGEDPVGGAVRAMRAQSASLTEFIKRMSWMWRYDQLQRAVEPANEPGS